MREFFAQYAGKSATTEDFREFSEKRTTADQLTWFFSQWLDSTGAPEFKAKYSIYRLGSNKGFRVVGADLPGSGPVPHAGGNENRYRWQDRKKNGSRWWALIHLSRWRPSGARDASRSIPITACLKNSVEVRLRAWIQRGQALVQQGDLAGALGEFNKALDKQQEQLAGSLSHCGGFFLQHNYQASANAYRESLNGDGEPRWTEVWSHIQLGKIFDITGQRERAINEYRQAVQTNDNTQGAIDECRRYMQKPYEREKDKQKEGN